MAVTKKSLPLSGKRSIKSTAVKASSKATRAVVAGANMVPTMRLAKPLHFGTGSGAGK